MSPVFALGRALTFSLSAERPLYGTVSTKYREEFERVGHAGTDSGGISRLE